MMSFSRSFRPLPWMLALALVCGSLVGCDDLPGVAPTDPRPPEVSNFTFAPDSVNAANLSPEQIQDGQAQVNLQVGVTAEDPDGTVRRVLFTIAPASTPGESIQGELVQESDTQYGAAITVGLPAGVDEIYTIRVFAIDDDDLTSNQAIGTLRFVPQE